MEEKKEYINECGLWAKEGKYGDYFTGLIKTDSGKEYWVNLYKNESENPKAPVYRLKLNAAEKKETPTPENFSKLEEDIPF